MPNYEADLISATIDAADEFRREQLNRIETDGDPVINGNPELWRAQALVAAEDLEDILRDAVTCALQEVAEKLDNGEYMESEHVRNVLWVQRQREREKRQQQDEEDTQPGVPSLFDLCKKPG